MKCPICNSHDTQARSIPQHKRFFGVLRAAFFHWPEVSKFQPESEEHLRAYLLVKTGHHTLHSVQVNTTAIDTVLTTVRTALRAAGSYAFVETDGHDIKIFKPKSIAFHKLSSSAFNTLNQKVEEVYRENGIDPDAVLNETERAA